MPRWRSLALVGLGALLALLLVAGASAASGLFGGPDTETLEAPAYRFEHPAEWQPIEGVSFPLAEAAGREDVGEHTIGIDPDNYVTVFATFPHAGIIGGLANTASQVGGSVGLAALATAASARAAMEAGGDSPAALAAGYDLVFLMAAGLGLAIAVVSVLDHLLTRRGREVKVT